MKKTIALIFVLLSISIFSGVVFAQNLHQNYNDQITPTSDEKKEEAQPLVNINIAPAQTKTDTKPVLQQNQLIQLIQPAEQPKNNGNIAPVPLFRSFSSGICGDADSNGRITPNDAILLAQVASGVSASVDRCANVNPDGAITIIDSLLIQQYLRGIIPTLQCPKGCVLPLNVSNATNGTNITPPRPKPVNASNATNMTPPLPPPVNHTNATNMTPPLPPPVNHTNTTTNATNATNATRLIYPSLTLCGDANGNGAVGITDSFAVSQVLIGLAAWGTTNLACVDVNGDGHITYSDSSRIAGMSIGIARGYCPAGCGTSIPLNTTNTTNATNTTPPLPPPVNHTNTTNTTNTTPPIPPPVNHTNATNATNTTPPLPRPINSTNSTNGTNTTMPAPVPFTAPPAPPSGPVPFHKGVPDIIASTSLCGDANNDGQISILDAQVLSQHAAGLVTVTGSCADVNNDGELSVADSLVLAQYMSGQGRLQCPVTCVPNPADLSWSVIFNPSSRSGFFNVLSTAIDVTRLPPLTMDIRGTNICTVNRPYPQTIQRSFRPSGWSLLPTGGFRVLVESNVISCPAVFGSLTSTFTITNPLGSPFNQNSYNDVYTFQHPNLPGPDRAISPIINVIPGGLTSCDDTDSPYPGVYPSNRPAVPGTVTYTPPGTPYADTCLDPNRLREYACQNSMNTSNFTSPGWGVISQDWNCAVGCNASTVPAFCNP